WKGNREFSHSAEERFLDCASRPFARAKGRRGRRLAPLGMTSCWVSGAMPAKPLKWSGVPTESGQGPALLLDKEKLLWGVDEAVASAELGGAGNQNANVVAVTL